jgi:2,3,4,5-tetrahydropyridine-2,6-dicarboxylate N-succinyltransferase
MDLKERIEQAWADRDLLKHIDFIEAVREVIEGVDKGNLRVAEPG